jgi:chromosome segregation ATPase
MQNWNKGRYILEPFLSSEDTIFLSNHKPKSSGGRGCQLFQFIISIYGSFPFCRIDKLLLESRDCSLLVPEEGGGAAGEVGDRLAATLAEHEMAAKEIETRTVQYQLLADRTTRDRDAAEHRMKAATELKEAAEDDLHTLSQNYYEMHAAKENAERELGVAIAQYDDSKTAWQRKLRDRRRDMKAMERRLAEETAEQAQRTQQAAFEAAKKEKEREAAQAQQYAAVLDENNPVILATLQEAEATWSRLRAVAGGSSPDEIIAAWQGERKQSNSLML